MTYQPTTPKEAEKVKRYFTERIASLKRSTSFYRDRLLKDSDDPFNLEIWDKIMEENPESAISYLTYRNLVEVYEMLNIFADNLITTEKNILTLDDNIKIVGNKNHKDISLISKSVVDLEKSVLPSVKKLTNFVDRAERMDADLKKNGGKMVV